VVLLEKLNRINEDLGFSNYTAAFGYDTEAGRSNLLAMFCVTAALMAGTAGLPHVIVRFYTVKNVAAGGLAAASFFPAIVLGIFSKRVGTVPAVVCAGRAEQPP
jgi:cation/acetate symporter